MLKLFTTGLFLFLFFITGYAVYGLIRSNIFMKDLRSHQNLMLKIEQLSDKGFDEDTEKKQMKMKGSPGKGLMSLIYSTSQHSKKIARIYRLVLIFTSIMCVVGIIQVFIWVYNPASLSVFALVHSLIQIFCLFIAVLLIYLIHEKFDFVRIRYLSIEYALKEHPVSIPKGNTPVERYHNFVALHKGYEYLAENRYWKRGSYFDAEVESKKGQIFVKYLENVPTIKDIETFRSQVKKRSGNGPLNRTVLIYNESSTDQLSDEAYDLVIGKPIIQGKDICNIQLVIEGKDGKYDFIPVVSF